MTKTLILPDVHNRIGLAEQIISYTPCDRIVFLGDYFDDFNDSPMIAHQVAIWLKGSLGKGRTHLMGNHDLGYATNGQQACAGWNSAKQLFVNRAKVNWAQLRESYYVGGWLCTHAGLSNGFYEAYKKEGEYVTSFISRYKTNQKQRLWDCSPARGGRNAYSGIIWCDYDEFEPIPNQKQIFGHTASGKPRYRNPSNICLDTFSMYYAVHYSVDDKIRIKEFKC